MRCHQENQDYHEAMQLNESSSFNKLTLKKVLVVYNKLKMFCSATAVKSCFNLGKNALQPKTQLDRQAFFRC